MTAACCDVAVLGAGPAGANAALLCAQNGLNTALVDEQPKAGGQVWRAKAAPDNSTATPESLHGNALRAALETSSVNHFANTRVWHIRRNDERFFLQLSDHPAVRELRCKALILATGAQERVFPVKGWTLPGVIGLAGATALFKQHSLPPGQRTVVAGNGPLLFLVAAEILRLGGDVAAVVSLNSRRDWLRAAPAMLRRPDLLARGVGWMAQLRRRGVPLYWQHTLTRISGDQQVNQVTIQSCDNQWHPLDTGTKTLEADSVCLGHGLLPAAETARLLGLETHFDAALGGWVPQVDEDRRSAIPRLYLCGDGSGVLGVDAAQAQGRLAATSAMIDLLGDSPERQRTLQRQRAECHHRQRFGRAMAQLSLPRPGLLTNIAADAVVCRCENLRRCDIEAEIDAGASDSLALKSGTRAGMGPCGGRFCMDTVARLTALRTGVDCAAVPPPTARPPLRPVPIDVLCEPLDYEQLPIPKPAPL